MALNRGVYCLILHNVACSLRVGSLGTIAFLEGWHIYVGSALGPGGFSRVERHHSLASRKDRKPRWHIDSLLLSPAFTLASACRAVTGLPLECDLARAIGGESVHGFGCSDCRCASHLFYRPEYPGPEMIGAFQSLGLSCHEQKYEIIARER
ncbi:MAG: DUF123 domain-containing protein [Methanomicrobiaceae archaeon]|nr:DUF123 domain-containing protein [Methanomicrobiaceae archaeon]